MTDSAEKMARLDQVITNLVDVFIEYAKDDGNKCKLSKDELRNLLTKEMKNDELQDKIKPNDVDEAMALMDKEGDGQLNFREFSRFMSILARCYYLKKSGKGGKGGDKGGGKGGDKGGAKGRGKGRAKGRGNGGGKGGGEDGGEDGENGGEEDEQ